MDKKLDLAVLLPGTPERIYTAWLDSREHGLFTGAAAEIDPSEGGVFSAWDEYIHGKTLTLEPYRRILQSWRTTEFPEDAADSFVELLFQAEGGETRLTLRHTDIPDGQAEMYREGWEDYYFKPMREYFAR